MDALILLSFTLSVLLGSARTADLLLGTDPEEGDVLSVADFALPLQDTALANLQSESSTLWYAARRLNEGMDADAAAALNALWEKLV